MDYGQIPGIDKPISKIVQGTMMMSTRNQEESFALLDAVLDLGCTIIDTAHVYAGGDSERVIGAWLQARGSAIREKLVVLDKGAHHNQDRKRVTPFDIDSNIYDSLARLKTDYIDLYLLHRDDPSVPVGPIVEKLNEHYKAGRIHAFGGSNWSHQRLQEANRYAEEHNLVPFVASSPNYSLADQKQEPWADCTTISGPENEPVRAWYQETQMPLLTWSSLAGGFLTGRFRRDNLDQFTEGRDKGTVISYCAEDNFQRLDRAEALAKERGVTLPQIALAFVLNQPLNIFTLVGSASPEELKVNVEAAAVKLSPEELDWLDLKRETRE